MGQTLVCREESSGHARAISVRRPPSETPSAKDIPPCETTVVRLPGEPISTRDTSPGGKCLGTRAYRGAPPGDGKRVQRVGPLYEHALNRHHESDKSSLSPWVTFCTKNR